MSRSKYRERLEACVVALLATLATTLTLPALAQADAGATTRAPAAAIDEREAIVLPTRFDDDALASDASAIDGLLMSTLQDLGFTIDLSADRSDLADHALATRAKTSGKLVVRATLRPSEGVYELAVVAAHPGSAVLRMRVVKVEGSNLQVKAVAMLRDVATAEVPQRATPAKSVEALVEPAHSEGRAVLAINGTVFGGFLGYSIQRSSGSDDPRLLYPLMAVGSGVGLGAAIIVSDEWNVGNGEAWFLTAGTWWPAAAAHLIHAGRFGATSRVDNEQWTFGLIGSVTGVTLSTALLLDHGMGAGGALLAHSGGATGMVLGGLIDMGVSGIHDEFPLAGMGYGAAGGWLLASSIAALWEPSASEVLIVDLGLLLGGLAGASAASPLLFDKPDADKTRGWVSATGGGLLAGGALALLFLPDDDDEAPSNGFWHAVPAPSLVGLPPGLGEIGAPGYGARWHGSW